MKLTTKRAYELLAEYGCYVTEICDKCGRLLGAIRFSRCGESGVWCSRVCRDGAEAREPGRCKHCKAKLPEGKRRGALYCDDACKQAAHRAGLAVKTARIPRLSVTQMSIYAVFSPEESTDRVAGYPKDLSCVSAEIGRHSGRQLERE